MRKAMVIPTYWARPSAEGWKPGDAVYDHPTPLDQEGTLARAIKSIEILKDLDFTLVIIAAATSPEIEEKVEERVKEIVSHSKPPVPTLVFSHSDLRRFEDRISLPTELLSLRGYSPIRNMCLWVPHLLGADVVILIDDDEVFEDPHFMEKAVEFLGEEVEGKRVLAKAGYYIQPYGGYLLKKEFEPWMGIWDNLQQMNRAFEVYIGSGPRIKRTPFVFGGNAVLHREVFTKIPFDPSITRGEDIDYLMNAEIAGYSFFLDRQLSIRHLPPPKPHPLWMRMREDIIRFLYEREKINQAGLKAEDYDPYPGAFLREDLEDKVREASQLLALQYLTQGKAEDARQTLENVSIAYQNPFRGRPVLEDYLNLREKWEKMMAEVEERREELKRLLPPALP